MANLLKTGLRWLADRQKEHVAEEVAISDGTHTTSGVKATIGRKLLRIEDGAGGSRTELTDADFVLDVADYAFAGVATEPARGHTITATHEGTTQVYVVAPYGSEPPVSRIDFGIRFRIHTKLKSQT